MAIRGNTKNIALSAQSAKDLDPVESLVPLHIDLRNGHLTPAQNWERRPGLFLQWELVPPPPAPPPPPVTPPPPTPPPPGGICPETLNDVGIHSGYTEIINTTARVYRATAPDPNLAVYTGSIGAKPFITVFDMDNLVVLSDGNGNGYYMLSADWDRANGDLYATRNTLTGNKHRLGQWDPDDASLIREGPDWVLPSGSFPFDLKVGTTYIYVVYSTHHIYVFDKATLTMQTDINVGADLSHHCASITLDDNDNAWGITRGGGTYTGPNLLLKFESNGTITEYDITATMGAAISAPRTSFDLGTNSIICWVPPLLGKFDIATTTFLGGTVDTTSWTSGITPEMHNYPYQSKMWHKTATGFAEFDFTTMTESQSINWVDVIGAHFSPFVIAFVWMPSLGCLHAVHGVRPTQGPDRICFPC